jgi:CelD/BcsL family acetyltransferase involved in cellulose biosynthesis
MRTLRIDPLADTRWQAFVDRAARASVFAHPAWLGLVGTRYRYSMSALCIANETGEIVAGIPLALVSSRLTGRRVVALPFSDVCPPVYVEGADERVTGALSRALAAERERCRLDIEVRWRMDDVPGAHVVGVFLSHSLALEPDADAVLARASKSQVRRAITKARREGVVAEPATSRAALADFYSLHEQTRRRQAVPVQPRNFILRFEELFARGLGYVMISRHEGRPIAAAVFLTHGGTLTYKYGASDESFLDLRPNHVLFAEAIRLGCEAGLHRLDFGRTDPKNEGLARFKRSWGAEEEQLAYTHLSDRPPAPGRRIAERVVAEAIRRGPPATGRVIGTALYRHVG